MSLLFGWGAWAVATSPREFYSFGLHLNADYSYSIGSQNLMSASTDDITRFSSGGYEAFLKSLSNASPELFRSPVLVHTTGSLQPASFERPRAILYDGTTLLAFSEPKTETDRNVEVLKFDPASATFSALEILFSTDGKVKIDTSGTTCRACHGEALHPIWLSYDMWPNAYGSFAGIMVTNQEQTEFSKFLSESSKTGVYAYLSELKDDTQKLNGSDNMTMVIFNMMMRALLKPLTKAHDQLEPWRYALIAAFKGCSDKDNVGGGLAAPSYLPARLQALMLRSYADTVATSKAARLKKTSLLTNIFKTRLNEVPSEIAKVESRLDNETFVLADSRYLLENFGFSFAPFQTSNGSYELSIALPSNVSFALSTNMVQIFPSVFKELKPEIQDTGDNEDSWALFDCRQLQTASLKALAKETILPVLPVEDRVSPMSRCVSCHVAGTVADAPAIPFDNSHELRTWLNTNKNSAEEEISSGRMPKNATLTVAERASLLAALRRISE